jgi:hypothetical protein
MALTASVRDLIVRVVLAEAGGEGPQGQLAVLNVIKNRALSGAWGDPEKGGLTRLLTAPKQFAAPANVSPNDPNYQRVAAIVDQMANAADVPDPTNGATHFFSPSGMPGGIAPDWAASGRNVRRIGNQIFMTAPLIASTTAGTVDVHAPPPTEQTSGAAPAGAATDPNADRQFLASLSAHTDRAGDTANLNPQFASRMAAAIRQARAQGLQVSVESAFREPGQTGSAYDAGGNSSHSYGLAVDIAGLDGPNGPKTQRWAQIAQANGLSNPYGIGNASEFNHWQLPPVPLERTPQLLASLKTAKATGNYADVWKAYSGATPESQTATRQTYPPVASPGPPPAADVPAPDVQPVKAAQGPPAASPAAPGANDRFLVNQGMSTGVQGRPQLFTSLNLSPGAGAAPAPSPAPAPQATPLDQTPTPPPRPPGFGVNQSALTANPPTPPPRPPDLASTANPAFASAYPPPALASLFKSLFGTG